MATAKEEVRRLLDSLPDDASFEDVQYSIYVYERIGHGRREADDGSLIEQDEVESRMRRWLEEQPGANPDDVVRVRQGLPPDLRNCADPRRCYPE